MFLSVQFLLAHDNKREFVCFETSRNSEPALQEVAESYCLKSLYHVHWQRPKKPDVVLAGGSVRESERESCGLQPSSGVGMET